MNPLRLPLERSGYVQNGLRPRVRSAVLATIAIFGAATASLYSATQPDLRALEASSLSHGPMLGHVTTSSVRVWARTKRPGEFRVRYSPSPDLRDAMLSSPVRTALDHDNTGWVELRDLKSDTKYHYAIELSGHLADTRLEGRFNAFRTLPDPAAFRDAKLNPDGLFNFSFEVGSCNRQFIDPKNPEHPVDITYATMLRQLRDRVSFHILNGDWIYEESASLPWKLGRAREVTADQWMADQAATVRPPIIDYAQGITGVWENYKLYLGRGKNMAAFHREVPLFVMFDDHEIYNDIVGAGHVGLRIDSRRPEWSESAFAAKNLTSYELFRPFLYTPEGEVERVVFRDPALQAWQDYLSWANPDVGVRQPLVFGRARLEKGSDTLLDPKADFRGLDLAKSGTLHVHWGQANSGVYEIVRVIDRHRLQIRPSPTETEEARYSVGTNHYSRFRVGNCEFFLVDTRSARTLHNKRDPHDPKTSMLGPRQMQWLTEGLKRSDATFLFIVSSVSFMVPHGPTATATQDSKDESWTAFVHDRNKLLDLLAGLDKPAFLLTGDIHNSFAIKISPKVWEFMSGPHLSSNHRQSEMEDIPLSGPYTSRGRPVTVKWGTGYLADAGRQRQPTFCVVRVNNALNSPDPQGKTRWVAHPDPQVIFQFYDGITGELKYAQSISARSL